MLVLSWKSYLIREEGVTTFDDYIASHFERANGHEEGVVFKPMAVGALSHLGYAGIEGEQGRSITGKRKMAGLSSGCDEAFYTKGRDISKSEVLEEVAREKGLLIPAFIDACRNQKWKDLVYEETKRGQEVFGIRSIPAVVVGGTILVEGTVSIARYKQVIEEMQKQMPKVN